jgi:hypothetical protein
MMQAPNSVPAELTGGDANWVYTGTAIVDESPSALLENRVSFEGDFVKQGQTWKGAKVERIAPDSITLVGASGREYVLRLVEPELESLQSGNGGLRPVNPTLSGPIGGNVQVQPESAGRGPGRGRQSENGNAN